MSFLFYRFGHDMMVIDTTPLSRGDSKLARNIERSHQKIAIIEMGFKGQLRRNNLEPRVSRLGQGRTHSRRV